MIERPTPDRLPEEFDELNTAEPLFPLRAGPLRLALILAGAAILTGGLAALIEAWT